MMTNRQIADVLQDHGIYWCFQNRQVMAIDASVSRDGHVRGIWTDLTGWSVGMVKRWLGY